MRRQMEKHIGSVLTTDENGKTVNINVFQEMIEVTHSMSPHREFKDGLKRFTTAHGEAVNCVDENTYVIVSTGKRLIRLH